MKAIRVHQCGGADALVLEDVPVPEPEAGEARVKIESIGLNYIDIYQRRVMPPRPTVNWKDGKPPARFCSFLS